MGDKKLEQYSPCQQKLATLRQKMFLDSHGSNVDELLGLVRIALTSVIDGQGQGAVYPVAHKKSFDELIDQACIPEQFSRDPSAILEKLPFFMQGSVKANSPLMVKNIIPSPSFIHLAANLAVSLYMPNGVTGEDAADTLNSEIQTAASIAKLAGYNPHESSGVFTFGGTGTNLYGFKMGLYKADPDHDRRGITEDVVIIGSKPSHYSHQTASNWLGLGQDNYLHVGAHTNQTTKLDELEAKCRGAIDRGRKIACIEALGGTTSNMAIDDFEAIYKMRERLVDDYGLSYRPHIHADTVLGWAYLTFLNYDFDENPLELSVNVIAKLRKIVSRLKNLHLVDSFGIDFHKTGYMPYVSSMVMAKDKQDFAKMRRDGKIMTPLFHDDQAYNPGVFTLETSRSAANMLATWLSLEAIGIEGYQVLLANSLEASELIRKRIEENARNGLLIANPDSFGCDVFVRCYELGGDVQKLYEDELMNNSLLRQNDEYFSQFASWLLHNNEAKRVAVSKSSAAHYSHTGAPVQALRIYPLNPYIGLDEAEVISEEIIQKKIFFDQNLWKK